jgi:hypothetical protein
MSEKLFQDIQRMCLRLSKDEMEELIGWLAIIMDEE